MKESNYTKSFLEKELHLIGEFCYVKNDILTLQAREAKPQAIEKYRELIERNKNRRFIVSYSSKRAQHENAQRTSLLEKIEKKLHQGSNTANLVSNAAFKKYPSSEGKAKSFIDETKIEADAMRDGLHGVIANIEKGTLSLAHILSQ